MKNYLIPILLMGMVSLSPSTFAAGDVTTGKSLYSSCAACHGAEGEGNITLNAPRLTGLDTAYLERQLINFQQGIRGNDPKDPLGMQMAAMAKTLPDEKAVADVVAYIQTLPVVHAPITVQGDVAAGKKLYTICSACHGPDGKGIAAMNAPRLAGQDDFYLVTQLKNFKSHVRGVNPKDSFGQQMAPMAQTLANDEAINNVVAYINTL
jgi:cytochrome c oxidase subunit 2